jgi:hypothetical protein
MVFFFCESVVFGFFFFFGFFLSGVGDECVFGYKLVKKFINDC